jgi:3-hydroxyisobutyrate dehydrogenase
VRVAVLGTGTMGAPMARNLVRAGHQVRVFNRTREHAEPLAQDGAVVCDAAADAVAGAEVVITMVSDGDAVAEMVQPALGAFGDAVWAQMSTVGVAGIERLERMAGDAGVTIVDAPVSGTKQPAQEGTLVVLASGPAAARERCAPVFEAVGSRTVDLGERVGDGTRMKLVTNAWLVALVEGLAESVQLAEGLGVDPTRFLDVIDGGPLGPPYARLKGTMMIERSYEPSFALRWALKDARLVVEAAERAGLELPLAVTVAERMREAADAGHADEDLAATAEAGRG